MEVDNILFFITNNFYNYITSLNGFLSILIIIIIYHLILFFTRDRSYYRAIINEKDPESILIADLKSLPEITVIIPAWKENEVFKQALTSLTNLSYPNLKVIVNAGGDQKTLQIADSFQKFDNFLILRQESGTSRAATGKIKALNDCLSYLKGGIVFLTDADVTFTDEIILRMIYPIVNLGEDVVIGGVRPLESQEDSDLVLYLKINRNANFKSKFSRYQKGHVSGANTALKHEVIKAIGKFNEKNIYAEDRSRGEDIELRGYKIYKLTDYRGRIYTELPDNLKVWYNQKLRWNENFITFSYQKKKINLLKPLFLFFYSLIILIFPFLSVVSPFFLVIFIFLLFNSYLKKLRKLFFYRRTVPIQFRKSFSLIFYFEIIGFIFLEALIYVVLPFDLVVFLRTIKRKG